MKKKLLIILASIIVSSMSFAFVAVGYTTVYPAPATVYTSTTYTTNATPVSYPATATTGHWQVIPSIGFAANLGYVNVYNGYYGTYSWPISGTVSPVYGVNMLYGLNPFTQVGFGVKYEAPVQISNYYYNSPNQGYTNWVAMVPIYFDYRFSFAPYSNTNPYFETQIGYANGYWDGPGYNGGLYVAVGGGVKFNNKLDANILFENSNMFGQDSRGSQVMINYPRFTFSLGYDFDLK